MVCSFCILSYENVVYVSTLGIYRGNWVDGYRHGKGSLVRLKPKFIQSDKSTFLPSSLEIQTSHSQYYVEQYTGEWFYDTQEGTGTWISYIDGETYTGQACYLSTPQLY